MLTREHLINDIRMGLATLQNYIQPGGSVNLTDANVHAEPFVAGLLNLVYDWNLVSTNDKKANYPCIDLIDGPLGVQVTSKKGSEKINATIECLAIHDVDCKVRKLKFFSLVKKQDRYTINAACQRIQFDWKDDVLDFDEVIQKVVGITDLKRLARVREYVAASMESIFSRFSASSGRVELAGDSLPVGSLEAVFTTLIEEKTAGFVGREYILQEIQDTLASTSKGIVTVAGDPGAGKSAILAMFVKRTGCIGYFNIRSQGIGRADQFLRFLCRQLIARYDLPYPSVPDNATRDGAVLHRLLAEASYKLPKGASLLIAVDALDEADLSSHAPGTNILFLPPSLPSNAYFIVTRRRTTVPWLTSEPHHLIDLGLPQYQGATLHDIKTYIRNAALRPRLKEWIDRRAIKTDHFVEVMATKSENNFMYLWYVLPELEQGKYGDLNIDALPVGLERYYEYHWTFMGMTAKPLPRAKINIVYILSQVREPVSREFLSQLSSEDQVTVQEVLDDWQQFLHKDHTFGPARYSLYHASFRDFLSRKDIVQAAGVTLPGINKLISDQLWSGLFDTISES